MSASLEPDEHLISEGDFYEVWGVYLRPDGDFFEYREVVDQPLEHVWTIVDSGGDHDGNWYAVPGFHIVNKLGYVMTAKPWDDKTEQAIYFLDDLDDADVENEMDGHSK